MGKIAFVFPGQASQYVGMGSDLYQNFLTAKSLYNKANEILGFDLKKISFEGPEEELKQTRITQPAIFVLSVIIQKILAEKGLLPQMVAGHSLGEYSAIVTAGAVEFEDALQIVKVRGELMQNAGDENPGMMAAIIGLNEDKINEICDEAKQESVVQPANYNAQNQIVISGTVAGVEKAMELAKKAGAKLVVPLQTSGAFHSTLMNSAQDGLRAALEMVPIQDSEIPIYVNVTAEPITAAAQIKMALYKQITHSVRWAQSIENMIGDGAENFYEVGPKNVLSALLRRSYREVEVATIGTAEELQGQTK